MKNYNTPIKNPVWNEIKYSVHLLKPNKIDQTKASSILYCKERQTDRKTGKFKAKANVF